MDPTPVLRARGGRGAPKARRARCGRRAAGRQPTADLAGGAWDKWQSATRAQLARRRRSHTSLHTRLQRLVWADRRRICVLGGKSDLSNILYFTFSPDFLPNGELFTTLITGTLRLPVLIGTHKYTALEKKMQLLNKIHM